MGVLSNKSSVNSIRCYRTSIWIQFENVSFKNPKHPEHKWFFVNVYEQTKKLAGIFHIPLCCWVTISRCEIDTPSQPLWQEATTTTLCWKPTLLASDDIEMGKYNLNLMLCGDKKPLRWEGCEKRYYPLLWPHCSGILYGMLQTMNMISIKWMISYSLYTYGMTRKVT